MQSTQLRQAEWDAAYERGDNLALYPKEEVVKFLNRHVRKRTGPDTFRDILRPSPGHGGLRGLDYGCGVGRMTILMQEFGIEAWGAEISPRSLATAAKLADGMGYPELCERLIQFDGFKLPFTKGFFDVGTAIGVLDSMHFDVALQAVQELDRVISQVLFVDLISGDNDRFHPEFAGEEIVQTQVEQGTVQSYFNWPKVQQLFANTGFRIRTARLMTEQSVVDRFRYSRYHIVLYK